ncbi:hypothetical protein YC2023_044613 [Brassica napus]
MLQYNPKKSLPTAVTYESPTLGKLLKDLKGGLAYVRGKATSVETLLNDVSSDVCYGDILVVFGEREVGKSMLVGRVNTLRGTVTLDGEKVLKTQLLKVISAYIMQDNILFPLLTKSLTLDSKLVSIFSSRSRRSLHDGQDLRFRTCFGDLMQYPDELELFGFRDFGGKDLSSIRIFLNFGSNFCGFGFG